MKIRFLCLFMFTCLAAWGQGSTAQISGSIQDSSGAAVPAAEVKATQTATGAARTAISGPDGGYVLANLPVGPYQLEVTKQGFTKHVQSGIVLLVDSSPTIDIPLKIGSVNEQVVVQAEATLVETRNSGIGQVVENQRILELPLNGRVVTDLITLSGAAVQTGTTRDNTFAGAIIAVGGGLSFGTAYTLDGARHVNFITAAPMPLPFPDALQEFKIETSGLAAQHSQETEVSSVTKSGSNSFHGDVFEFLRNDLFNANPYNVVGSAGRSTLKRNQFGGTLGGRILKDKLFFFAGYQETTLRQDAATAQAFVPTAKMLAGDWTDFASPACNAGRQITLGAPFFGNKIDPAAYNTVARNILSKLNQTAQNPCGLVVRGTPISRNDGQVVGRVDYQLSEKQSLFGRYVANPVNVKIPFSLTPNNLLNTTNVPGTPSPTGYDNLAQSFAIGDTYVFSPTVVNAFRLGFNRAFIGVRGPTMFSLCDAGSKIYCGYSGPMFSLTMTGGGSFAIGTRFSRNSDFWSMTSYQVGDDISIVRGAHQFSFGGNASLGKNQEIYYYYAIPTLAFDGSATGLGMADFMLGKVATLNIGAPTDHTMRQTSISAYATDTWKINRRLTLNYGLRWEPYLPQVMFHNRVLNFDMSRFLQGTHSVVFPNAPAGVYYPGDPGFPGQSGVNNQWAHFAPRLGLAWDVNGDGRTSVRASLGYGYNYVSGLWREDYSAGSPWTNYTTLTGVSLDNPWQNVPGGNPFPIDLNHPRFSAYTNFQSMDYNTKTPTTASWNLSIQRQVGSDWILSASYIGNETAHVWTQKPGNPAVFLGLGPCSINGVSYTTCSTTSNTNQRRQLSLSRPQDGQLIGYLGLLDPGANVSYQAMLLSVQHRFSKNFTLQSNYTWSHCIASTYADLTSGGPDATETYSNPNNRNADRGPCYADRRHILNFTGVARTPRFSGRTLGILANNWSLSGIYKIQSGQPLDVFMFADRALTGITVQRPNQVLANVYGPADPGSQYLNPLAFSRPALGATGNVGYNSVLGPKFWSFDVSLSRTFAIHESQKIEIRAEAYNLTNSFRPTLVLNGNGGSVQGQTIDSNTFGQIRSSLDPRIMQFALKYVF
jgi:hypothetical protein